MSSRDATSMVRAGALAAMAAATLLGCRGSGTQAPSDTGAVPTGQTAQLGHCYGVNQCKGHNDCKTAENSCAGEAECKGHGFVAMPEKACGDVGGEIRDEWRGPVASADLVHCYGINQCKGHNDCKTAENACAGQAECKGHGFVATTPKACDDVGGEVGA